MTKREKEKIAEAINILMDDNGDFHKAIWILAKLIGQRHEVYEILKNTEKCSLADFINQSKEE